MTHLWKSKEEYFFDMPYTRIADVYGKNTMCPLWPYIKFHCPKVTKIWWEPTGPGLCVDVDIPKYPSSSPHFKPGDKTDPYFNNDDVNTLLKAYMDYANMTVEEIQAWYASKTIRELKE